MKKWKIIICCSILLFFVIIGIILYWYYNSKKRIYEETCGPKHKVKWQDPQCYEKCMDWCSYEDCPIMGWDCWNECTLRCETPKYENCISKCKDLEVDWYDEQHYYERFEQTKPYLNNRREYDERLEKKGIKNATLPEKYKYDEWIKDTFTWNKREIEEYESCKSTCWEEPRIIPWN
jgi:hypothetical protein